MYDRRAQPTPTSVPHKNKSITSTHDRAIKDHPIHYFYSRSVDAGI